jgi:hypothetical protein
MINASTEAAVKHGNTESPEGASFERDTRTWAFAKLSECVLDDLFRQAGEQARYARWLSEEAPLLIEGAGPAQGLLLIDLELGADGRLSVIARPCDGEFILTVRHQHFNVVLASSYGALAAQPEQECICVAHFEGDSALAARWASGLRHSLLQRRQHPPLTHAPAGARLH